MKALVIYDSWYGNTEAIARAIGEGLGDTTQLVQVKDAVHRSFNDYELLVIGSPTHGGIATPAMQEFLDSMSNDELEGIAVAAFDTRASYRWLKFIGFASDRIAKLLQEKGGTLITPPVGFYVSGKEGPLKEDETDRAKVWAYKLMHQVQGAAV